MPLSIRPFPGTLSVSPAPLVFEFRHQAELTPADSLPRQLHRLSAHLR